MSMMNIRHFPSGDSSGVRTAALATCTDLHERASLTEITGLLSARFINDSATAKGHASTRNAAPEETPASALYQGF